MNSVLKSIFLLFGVLILSSPALSQKHKEASQWQAEIMGVDCLEPEAALLELAKFSPKLEKDFPELLALAECQKAWQLFKLEKLDRSYALFNAHLAVAEPLLDDWQNARYQYSIYEYLYAKQPDSLNYAEAKQFRASIMQIET
ncbi:MAG: hypothetical protein AAFN10_21245, partial [Bacteroidota bacterium]